MEVILKEDVEKIGDAGARVKVADGYARNFLIPQGLALRATSAAVSEIEHHMKLRAKKLAVIKEQAEAMAVELGKLRLTFTRKSGEEGKLFGSVTASDIGNAVVEKNFNIDKRKVLLDMPLKTLGEHKVKIKIHPEVTAEITVEVKAEMEEAPIVETEQGGDAGETAEEQEKTEEPKAE